jgi:hypothetical protein
LITTFWPEVDGTAMLLVAGVDASTELSNRKCVSGTMAAQASTQPIETKSNLIDKPRERVRDFSDLRDITILPLIAVNFEIALSSGIIVIKKPAWHFIYGHLQKCHASKVH